MKKKQANKVVEKKAKLRRTNKICITLNDEEKKYIEHYVKKYGISSTARFVRGVVMKTILQDLDLSSPTLFD
jgi:hypothetical protein